MKSKQDDRQPGEILRLTISKQSGYKAEYKSTDDVVIACTDIVTEHMQVGDQMPLSVLFSIVVHVLARETTGSFEKQFLKNVSEQAAIRREHYAKAMKEHPDLGLSLTSIAAQNAKKMS